MIIHYFLLDLFMVPIEHYNIYLKSIREMKRLFLTL